MGNRGEGPGTVSERPQLIVDRFGAVAASDYLDVEGPHEVNNVFGHSGQIGCRAEGWQFLE
jgi:hypothetical protein